MMYGSADMHTIKNYILDEFLPGEEPNLLTPTTPLVSSGILDSLATLKLVSFLEQTFDIRLRPHETDEEHLDTLEAICGLVESKR
jgi:acyl carrier protein